MNATQAQTAEEFRVLPFELSWWGLLRISAYGALVVLILTMVTLHDLLAAGLSILMLAALGLLLFRWTRPSSALGIGIRGAAQLLAFRFHASTVGLILLGFLMADMGFYTVTGAAVNLVNGADLLALALPAVLGTFCVVGLISIGAILKARGRWIAPSDGARNVAVAALLVLVTVLLLGAFTGRQAAAGLAAPAELELGVENLAYSSTSLSAPAGEISVRMQNHDLFWHTFTIEALNVDMKVPMRASGVVRFSAPPGSYTYYCSIPGHEMLGMKGTLVVP